MTFNKNKIAIVRTPIIHFDLFAAIHTIAGLLSWIHIHHFPLKVSISHLTNAQPYKRKYKSFTISCVSFETETKGVGGGGTVRHSMKSHEYFASIQMHIIII